MMQGDAGGDGGRVRHNTRKRDLDDTVQDGFDKPSSKRRLATSAPGHHDDESTSNSSSFKSRRPKVERNSTLQSHLFQLDTLPFSLRSSGPPAPQKYGSLNTPTSSDSGAKPSGPPGAIGGRWGAKPNLPGGIFSGLSHHKSSQSPLSDGPPTSSTTSSDASSIPARSTEILPFSTSKHKIKAPFESLRYGDEPENGAAAEGGSHNGKPGQGAEGRSHNTRHGATSKQRWQSERQDDVPPVSRLNGTRETPQAISSSDDDLYVGEDGKNDDDDAVPTTRQRSARLRDLGSTGNALLKGSSDVGANDEHGIKPGRYKYTPSGKSYRTVYNEKNTKKTAKFALFPDGYRLTGPPGHRFPCPVRIFPVFFWELKSLDQHFKEDHTPSEFNDNLDGDGTLEYIRRRKGHGISKKSIVVSQNARHPTEEGRKRKPAEIAAGIAPKGTIGLLHDSPSPPGDAKKDSASANGSELHRAMAESKVWAYVAPLVPNSWAASIMDDLEKRAFIQAISLPLKNEMDMEWLAGTRGSHQRLYRALMSVIFQAVGNEAHCKPCDSKIPERRRNCKVLPPEAAGMRELQEVCGSRCVNCFFFQASKPCEFPDSSTSTKQTPVPVPVPPFPRSTPVIERSHDSRPTEAPHPTVASRPFVPPYSLYKVQKTEKPISESPVPIPSFTIRGPGRQSESHNTSDVAPEKTEIKPLRRSTRVSKADGEPGKISGFTDTYTTEAQSCSTDPAAPSGWPPKAALTSGGSNSETLTEVASNLPSGEFSTSRLASRMFSLFGDIGRLPAEEQANLWNQMQQMSAMLRTSDSGVPRASGTRSTSPSVLHGPSAAADEWEIAPGKLIVDDRPIAFSTSFLSREVISVTAAQQLSPNHRVLNKSIAALNQLSVGPEEGWKCTFSVIRGVLKIKAGDMEARIGQGGLMTVEKKCIITNVSHKEARVQVCWVGEA